jgi:membrane fusion protein (multidrug efflux system)
MVTNMRKFFIVLFAAGLILSVGCGKPGSGPDAKGTPQERQGEAQRSPDRKAGGKIDPSEIDVDKLDIPDQMKEAIKSGRIPKDKIPEMLARMRGDGGDAVPVSIGQILRKDLNSYLVLNGIVEPERMVEVFSRLSAYVKQIVKEEGDYVRKNDVLALLDDEEIRIGYQQAKINLEQSELSLEEAEKNYLRNQELIKKDLISIQEYQTQESEYKQRQLDLKDRQENFKNLELQLNWTKIRALSDGYITERLIEVGDRVTSNAQVYTIEDFSPLLIRVFVPTSDVIQLETGMPAEISTEVLTGAVFNGQVKLINPRIDVQTGTVKVTVETYDKTLRLKPGMFVEVRIAVGQKENVLVMPRKAILYKQNKTFAFVVNGRQVSQREITLGLTEEDEVEVTSGLEDGETIVVVGVESLKDGQRIDIVR